MGEEIMELLRFGDRRGLFGDDEDLAGFDGSGFWRAMEDKADQYTRTISIIVKRATYGCH